MAESYLLNSFYTVSSCIIRKFNLYEHQGSEKVFRFRGTFRLSFPDEHHYIGEIKSNQQTSYYKEIMYHFLDERIS